MLINRVLKKCKIPRWFYEAIVRNCVPPHLKAAEAYGSNHIHLPAILAASTKLTARPVSIACRLVVPSFVFVSQQPMGTPNRNRSNVSHRPLPATRTRGGPPNLLQIFQAIDTNRNGRISAEELQRALSNGTWRPFNGETCRLLVQMFDADNDGGISFNEFQALWNYINDWSRTFRRFDLDNSGDIDRAELANALNRFGYRLSSSCLDMLMRTYDRMEAGRINFDDFIQLCVTLQILTAAFRHKDADRDGWIRIHYEEFLTMVLQSKIN